MNSLGVYFGTNSIGLAEVNNKKLVNSVVISNQIYLPVILKKSSHRRKGCCLIKDALRTNHINADHGTMCISGQDLIIRTFEYPGCRLTNCKVRLTLRPRNIFPSGWKDLVYSFQVETDNRNKLNTILFVGIKKEVLEKYISLSSS